MSNIFKDDTPMPLRPEGSVSAATAPGDDTANNLPTRMPGLRSFEMNTTHVARPRRGHDY